MYLPGPLLDFPADEGELQSSLTNIQPKSIYNTKTGAFEANISGDAVVPDGYTVGRYNRYGIRPGDVIGTQMDTPVIPVGSTEFEDPEFMGGFPSIFDVRLPSIPLPVDPITGLVISTVLSGGLPIGGSGGGSGSGASLNQI